MAIQALTVLGDGPELEPAIHGPAWEQLRQQHPGVGGHMRRGGLVGLRSSVGCLLLSPPALHRSLDHALHEVAPERHEEEDPGDHDNHTCCCRQLILSPFAFLLIRLSVGNRWGVRTDAIV